jgi:hypothetical protein
MRTYNIKATTKKGWVTTYEIYSSSYVEAKQYIIRERDRNHEKHNDPRLIQSQCYELKEIKSYG